MGLGSWEEGGWRGVGSGSRGDSCPRWDVRWAGGSTPDCANARPAQAPGCLKAPRDLGAHLPPASVAASSFVVADPLTAPVIFLGHLVFFFFHFWCLRPSSTAINSGSQGTGDAKSQEPGESKMEIDSADCFTRGHFRRCLSDSNLLYFLRWNPRKRQLLIRDPRLSPRRVLAPLFC